MGQGWEAHRHFPGFLLPNAGWCRNDTGASGRDAYFPKLAKRWPPRGRQGQGGPPLAEARAGGGKGIHHRSHPNHKGAVKAD